MAIINCKFYSLPFTSPVVSASRGNFSSTYFSLYHTHLLCHCVCTVLYVYYHVSWFLHNQWFLVMVLDANTNPKSVKLREDWRKKSKPIPPGGTYPAKDHCRLIYKDLHFIFLCSWSLNMFFSWIVWLWCLFGGSQCGLCDTYYIAHVKNACAFLGDGMSRIEVSTLSVVQFDIVKYCSLYVYLPHYPKYRH